MSVTEDTFLHWKINTKSSQPHNGARFKSTWGPPGGHQKRRPIRKNIWFRDINHWWPPLLRLLNINNHESGGHQLLISRNHIFFRMDRLFWWPPGGPQVAFRVFKSRAIIEEMISFVICLRMQECVGTNGPPEWTREILNGFFPRQTASKKP